jgi:hypothetical protein
MTKSMTVQRLALHGPVGLDFKRLKYSDAVFSVFTGSVSFTLAAVGRNSQHIIWSKHS